MHETADMKDVKVSEYSRLKARFEDLMFHSEKLCSPCVNVVVVSPPIAISPFERKASEGGPSWIWHVPRDGNYYVRRAPEPTWGRFKQRSLTDLRVKADVELAHKVLNKDIMKSFGYQTTVTIAWRVMKEPAISYAIISMLYMYVSPYAFNFPVRREKNSTQLVL
jgi:hypothetical protein